MTCPWCDEVIQVNDAVWKDRSTTYHKECKEAAIRSRECPDHYWKNDLRNRGEDLFEREKRKK